MTTDHKAYADGLRKVADFYDKNPAIPMPEPVINNYAVDSREEAARVMRALGTCRKEFNESIFTLVKEYGPVSLRFIFTRANVCQRKVVAVETIPARFIVSHIEPARTKEIYEWDCGPVLDGAQE